MEDNIGDMMVEIQNVVSNHLSNVKKDLQDTMNVINKLPLVISLRNQIRKLENENKQLKMLVDSIGEEKNIELEIVEVPKKNLTNLSNMSNTAGAPAAAASLPFSGLHLKQAPRQPMVSGWQQTGWIQRRNLRRTPNT